MPRRLSTLAACLLLSACANAGDLHVYSPAEVNSHLDELEGRRITVRGYVRLGTNSRVLYQSRYAHARAERTQTTRPEFCLTILNDDELLWGHSSLLRDQTILVEGVVHRRDPRTFDLKGCLNDDATPVASGFLIDQASLQRAIDHLP